MVDGTEPITDPYEPFPSFPEWEGRRADVHLVNDFSEMLTADRAESSPELWSRMLDITNKWAAVDTGAIENLYEVDRGFTYTVAATTVAWARIPQEKGEAVARVIADQLAGYEHVLDAATANVPISEYWIRGLHEVLCRSQDTYRVLTSVGWRERPLQTGAYKKDPNNPLNLASNHIHNYASPADVVPEMERFVAELRSAEFLEAPAVIQAAYAHYAFVCIHPFPDGNGRVSRALASVFLYRAYGVPIVIFADQKARYLDALEAADAKRGEQFTVFFRDCVIDTINLIRAELETARTPELADQLSAFEVLLTGRGGLEHEVLDEVADRLTGLVSDEVQSARDSTPLRSSLTLSAVNGAVSGRLRDGYRHSRSTSTRSLRLQSARPASAQSERGFSVQIARPDTDGADFIVVDEQGGLLMHVFLREVYPVIAEGLRIRVRAMVEAALRRLLAEVATAAEQALRDAGYGR
ncbi:Fic family protein [Rathayibacter sp. PhB127]|uniref:Fic family protein n=1 Tax=Rathayibacter sp. PhB127 TaxID=2485176 RepID=UPI000F4CB009|nr:Fic family protein [Rathayibacter sp. PhB127]ROS23253.1 Fic family protein [Rathayibacter sp. PhB127]